MVPIAGPAMNMAMNSIEMGMNNNNNNIRTNNMGIGSSSTIVDTIDDLLDIPTQAEYNVHAECAANSINLNNINIAPTAHVCYTNANCGGTTCTNAYADVCTTDVCSCTFSGPSGCAASPDADVSAWYGEHAIQLIPTDCTTATTATAIRTVCAVLLPVCAVKQGLQIYLTSRTTRIVRKGWSIIMRYFIQQAATGMARYLSTKM